MSPSRIAALAAALPAVLAAIAAFLGAITTVAQAIVVAVALIAVAAVVCVWLHGRSRFESDLRDTVVNHGARAYLRARQVGR